MQRSRNSRTVSIHWLAWGKIALLALMIVSMAWFAFFAKDLLLKYPPVWPDEALFANPAMNLLDHGRMSTNLLDGTLPGIGQHTYWMPPLYFLYITAVFRFTGSGIVPLRLASLSAALAVLVLTYLLAVRTGLGRWLSLLPVSFVALDTVFLRGALIGRMDILALALLLLSLWLATKPVAPWDSFVTGIVCALAALTHPIGVVAPVSVVIWCLLSRERRALRYLMPLLSGILVAFLPWLVYILLDPQSFVVQFGAQLAAKSRQHASVATFLTSVLKMIAQYGVNRRYLVMVLLLWFVGMAGLGNSGLMLSPNDCPARRSLLLCCGCQALTIAAILLGGQMWYPIYAIPVGAIGLCHWLNYGRPIGSVGWRRTVLTSLFLFWIGGFLWINIQNTMQNYVQSGANSESDYTDWSSRISRNIPPGSKVLLSIIPDPYFGLIGRDLSIREFLPDAISIDPDLYWRYMSQADYVIVGIGSRGLSPRVDDFVQSSCALVDTVGSNRGGSYFALIYRVIKHTTR